MTIDSQLVLYTPAQVRELDQQTIEVHGIPGYTLMRRAAESCFSELMQRWPGTEQVIVFCGGGNNGGDGYLLAVRANAAGLQASCYWLSDPEQLSGDARLAWQSALESDIPVAAYHDAVLLPEPGSKTILIDAVLGIGLSLEVGGEFAKVIAGINASELPVVAMDIPSGLNASTGAVMGIAIKADLTTTFIGYKRGLFTHSGPDHCGEIILATLGAPPSVYETVASNSVLLDEALLATLLPARERNANKGRHGHLLAVGGDEGMSGAIRLAAEAALRSGSGLVSVATRKEHAVTITQQRPELMCHGVESAEALDVLLGRANVVAIGPGLGRSEWGRFLLNKILESDLPLVLDADALNLIAEQQSTVPVDAILTPHPGEAARLLNCDIAEVESDRFAAVSALQSRYGCYIVLKGAGSLVTGPDEVLSLCPYGNPGMAVAGMGDTLTGVISALRAQGLAAFDAARLGVMIHALAGDIVANAHGERGLIPSDLLPEIRRLVNPVSSQNFDSPSSE